MEEQFAGKTDEFSAKNKNKTFKIYSVTKDTHNKIISGKNAGLRP